MAKRKSESQPQEPKQLSLPGEPTGQVPVVIPQGSAELGEPNETEPQSEEELSKQRQEAAQRYYDLYFAGHGTPPSNIPEVVDSQGQLVDLEGKGLDILAEDSTLENVAQEKPNEPEPQPPTEPQPEPS